MRLIALLLLAMIGSLQYRLWVADGGMREVWRLKKEVAVQADENTRLRDRNRSLAAEVLDLKKGRSAIEERARADLGMVGANETFFQVAPLGTQSTRDGDHGVNPPIAPGPGAPATGGAPMTLNAEHAR